MKKKNRLKSWMQYYEVKETGLKKINIGFQAYEALQKSRLMETEKTLVIAKAWREKERGRGLRRTSEWSAGGFGRGYIL